MATYWKAALLARAAAGVGSCHSTKIFASLRCDVFFFLLFLKGGRGWKASELRLKSWDDLHKLWYVLLKEKNMLMSQRQMLASESMRFPNPERISKVKRSMCRIKHVLTERAIADPDPRRTAEMKRMINAM
ncbi:39S ribosomal protein L47, mitochondrial [Triticum urartu]|uniref:Large ribosomal subunit protein uL29m n=1 Tax=Triticum urartu TaxID=4572 RepID=M7ZW80_TRIUA|nr:39S ribosomal protein L47, mitochondrial [Triticum urartu]